MGFGKKEDKNVVKSSVFSFMLNYENKTITQANDIEEETAKDIINSFTPEILNQFKERHRKLKEELKDDVLKILKNYKRKIPELPKFKIGRNDPCPCGSGRKYKKCCLSNN